MADLPDTTRAVKRMRAAWTLLKETRQDLGLPELKWANKVLSEIDQKLMELGANPLVDPPALFDEPCILCGGPLV